MSQINPHDECIKQMQPFFEIISELNATIKLLTLSQERLVRSMCEQSGYPEELVHAFLHKMEFKP